MADELFDEMKIFDISEINSVTNSELPQVVKDENKNFSVALNGEIFSVFNSLNLAIFGCLKIMQVLDCKYPDETKNFFTFIHRTLYGLPNIEKNRCLAKKIEAFENM